MKHHRFLRFLLTAALLVSATHSGAASAPPPEIAVIHTNEDGVYVVEQVMYQTKEFRNNSGIFFSLKVTPPTPKALPKAAKVLSSINAPPESLRYFTQTYRFWTQCDRPPQLEVLAVDFWSKEFTRIASNADSVGARWKVEPGEITEAAYKKACELAQARAEFFKHPMPSHKNRSPQ